MDRLSYLLKEAKFDEEKLFQNAVCKALKNLKKSKKIKLFFGRSLVIVDPTFQRFFPKLEIQTEIGTVFL